MKRYTKLAFLATEQASTARLVQVVGNSENLTDVYLVGTNAARLARLQESGHSVHQVATLAELPPDVFLWFSHEGFWGTVNKESGAIRDVGFGEDSLSADTVLLAAYTPAYRELFTVIPVDVAVHHSAPRRVLVAQEAV